MQRTRTVKPDFFHHYELYELEQETGLPIRIAWAGLWTCCDREGRFKWKPHDLKPLILPHDNVNFSVILDLFWEKGYVFKYEVDGFQFGFIDSFIIHQNINPREKESILPKPLDSNIVTRDPRGTNAPSKYNSNIITPSIINTTINTITNSKARQPRVNDASTTRQKAKSAETKANEAWNEVKCPHSDSFASKWRELCGGVRWKGKEVKTLISALKRLSKYDEPFALSLVESTIDNGYQGVVFSDTDDKYKKYLKENGEAGPSATNTGDDGYQFGELR